MDYIYYCKDDGVCGYFIAKVSDDNYVNILYSQPVSWLMIPPIGYDNPITPEEILRKAGCKCVQPLLGKRPGVGPRCRLCNTIGYDIPE